MIRLLVENGANINAVNNDNSSALITSLDEGNQLKCCVKEFLIKSFHFA